MSSLAAAAPAVVVGDFASYIVPKQLPLSATDNQVASEYVLSLKTVAEIPTTDSVALTFQTLLKYAPTATKCVTSITSTTGSSIAIANEEQSWTFGETSDVTGYKFLAAQPIPVGSTIKMTCSGFNLNKDAGLKDLPYVCSFIDNVDGTMSAHYEDNSFSLDGNGLFYASTVAITASGSDDGSISNTYDNIVTSSISRPLVADDAIEFSIAGVLVGKTATLTVGEQEPITVDVSDITPEEHTHDDKLAHHTHASRYSAKIGTSVGSAGDVVTLTFSYTSSHPSEQVLVAAAKDGFHLNMKHDALDLATVVGKTPALFINFASNTQFKKDVDMAGLTDTRNHQFPSIADMDCLGYVFPKQTSELAVDASAFTIRCVGFKDQYTKVSSDLNKAVISIKDSVYATANAGDVTFAFGTLPAVCGEKYVAPVKMSSVTPRHHTTETIYHCGADCGSLCPVDRPCANDGDCLSNVCDEKALVCKSNSAISIATAAAILSTAAAVLAFIF